ncbi:HupE/UreJ family protein [Methylosinus sp. LW4]|uniref:HupE/UreJ family protein n=1 Tax=Methylosinus sp. LW4 TaxID=136993 RepID=UPI000382ECCA|nr:HupE/UreJ family protein [Methylosinus sp. LW4]
MRLLAAWIVAATLLAPVALLAHESSLGVLELREVRQGAYVGRWTMEPTIGAARVDLRAPPHCFLRMPQLECGAKGLIGAMTIGNLGSSMSAALIKIIPLQGEAHSYTITSANPTVSILGSEAPTLESWIALGATYLNYGVDHILLGADHLLFVFGLIWIVGVGRRLVSTITAFTIGHSISLAAAAFGVIGVPERPLNACIALSIVFVGVEIVKQRRGEAGLTARYPWAVAGGFGLVHGIGFASALAGLGIEKRLLPAALGFFNIGVEIGQLAFVLLTLALIWAHRRLGAVLPGSRDLLPGYAIGSIAAFWFIGRLLRVLAID